MGVAVRGRWPLMLRTGWVVVRRMTRVSPSANSTARVVSETWTVTVPGVGAAEGIKHAAKSGIEKIRGPKADPPSAQDSAE